MESSYASSNNFGVSWSNNAPVSSELASAVPSSSPNPYPVRPVEPGRRLTAVRQVEPRDVAADPADPPRQNRIADLLGKVGFRRMVTENQAVPMQPDDSDQPEAYSGLPAAPDDAVADPTEAEDDKWWPGLDDSNLEAGLPDRYPSEPRTGDYKVGLQPGEVVDTTGPVRQTGLEHTDTLSRGVVSVVSGHVTTIGNVQTGGRDAVVTRLEANSPRDEPPSTDIREYQRAMDRGLAGFARAAVENHSAETLEMSTSDPTHLAAWRNVFGEDNTIFQDGVTNRITTFRDAMVLLSQNARGRQVVNNINLSSELQTPDALNRLGIDIPQPSDPDEV